MNEINLGIPQIIMLFVLIFNVVVECIHSGKIKKESKYNGTAAFIAAFINILILGYGGFFTK